MAKRAHLLAASFFTSSTEVFTGKPKDKKTHVLIQSFLESNPNVFGGGSYLTLTPEEIATELNLREKTDQMLRTPRLKLLDDMFPARLN